MTIEIIHTRAEGTLVHGTRRGDGSADQLKKRDYGSYCRLAFKWSRHLECWYLPHSRDKQADRHSVDLLAERLRGAGFEVTVTVNEAVRRSFTEAEADRTERAEARAERFEGYADNAATSANTAHAAAKRIADGIPFGQPILTDHHSAPRARRDAARIDTNMRKSISEAKRADYWQDRAEAAGRYEQHRNDPQRTARRLEKLRAELRQQERHHATAVEKGWDSAERHANNILDLKDEISHWEQVIEEAKARGVKLWEPGDFVRGDFAFVLGSWYEVVRVNPKSLSIAWNLRLAPKQVMTLEDASDNGLVGTHTTDYTKVQGRCPGEAMRAWLADNQVPGLKAAREASEAAPASELRATQAAKPKPQRRSDPKIPKRVKVECRWDATEATLTWLNGRSQPHKDHAPETITAPEGVKFTESVWSRPLLARVRELLEERGCAFRGRWTGSPGRGIVCAIELAPAKELAEAAAS
ncbi:DUF3560 domain-containing protein [Streptomyces sp. NPDC047968]|uniref:DUF3560 domain-containing protein n=1 Tax=unclassified Streptomyces TaxID=2593676 RepID=UPI00344350A0